MSQAKEGEEKDGEKDKGTWVTMINHMNQKAMPGYLKEAIPNKKE